MLWATRILKILVLHQNPRYLYYTESVGYLKISYDFLGVPSRVRVVSLGLLSLAQARNNPRVTVVQQDILQRELGMLEALVHNNRAMHPSALVCHEHLNA